MGKETNDVQVIARMPATLVEWLRAYAEHLTGEFGIPVSVAAAHRRLLTEGLQRSGVPAPPAPPERPKPAVPKKAAKKRAAKR